MAKSTRKRTPLKKEDIPETPPTVVEPSEDLVINTEPTDEPLEGAETTQTTDPESETTPEEPKVIETEVAAAAPPPVVVEPRKETDKNLPIDERIVAYLESRTSPDFVKLNDFLKSLYPLPKMAEPPVWLSQGVSKQIKNLLTDMQTQGRVTIRDNRHLMLGMAYYPDSTTLKTHYYNLNNVVIEASVAAEK